MKIANIEIFRKDVTYDNIKSRKKTGFHPLFKGYIFGKTTGGVNLTPSSSSFLRLSSVHTYTRKLIWLN